MKSPQLLTHRHSRVINTLFCIVLSLVAIVLVAVALLVVVVVVVVAVVVIVVVLVIVLVLPAVQLVAELWPHWQVTLTVLNMCLVPKSALYDRRGLYILHNCCHKKMPEIWYGHVRA